MVNDVGIPESDQLDALAEEFVARWRRGERPEIAEYEARCPALAEEIRALFPTLVFLERHKPPRVSSTTTVFSTSATTTRGSVPERLGPYQLRRELGHGGMGIVFEAWHERLERLVAVKILAGPAQHDEHARERFLREVRSLARLRHPHIVPIQDAGECDGLLYYVMEFIDGSGLDQLAADDAPAGSARRAGWPRWDSRPPRRWPPCMTRGSCTATSSPPICCSTARRDRSGSRISASPSCSTTTA